MRTERQSMGCLCPKHVEALGRIASQDEEIARLKSRLKIEVRNAREMPFEENTPPSKVNFRKDSDEAARLRQGGARPGHEGHGRRRVPAGDADERREAAAHSRRTCPTATCTA